MNNFKWKKTIKKYIIDVSGEKLEAIKNGIPYVFVNFN